MKTVKTRPTLSTSYLHRWAIAPWLVVTLIALAVGPTQSAMAKATSVALRTVGADQIPFEQAEVERDLYTRTISWASPATKVKVIAVADVGSKSGILVGEGKGSDRFVLPMSEWPNQRYFRLVPNHGSTLVIAPRGLGMLTVPNLRDVGGLRTVDGRWVKMGLLFRSDQLDQVSDADFAQINALDIGVVVDLRTANERMKGPDRLPIGATNMMLDVLGAQGDLNAVMRDVAQGQGFDLMMRLYGNMVTQKTSRLAFRALIEAAVTARNPMLFHCTAGKDRTGWGAAVILSLLGVPREVVIEDYLASNGFLAAKNERSYVAAAPHIARDRLEPVLTVRRDYIEHSFTEVDRVYGSMENYAHIGLGLTPQLLTSLRHKYLAGGPRR